MRSDQHAAIDHPAPPGLPPVAIDRPAQAFPWLQGVLPEGDWSEPVRETLTTILLQLGWAAVHDGGFDLLERLYRDFVSIYPRLMADVADVDRAANLYTLLHIMLWRRTQRLNELMVFNDDVVRPFNAYLERTFAKSPPRPAIRDLPRIAYLSETSDLFGSNAVARVTVSLMLGQNALRAAADRPILYCLNPPGADLRAFAADHDLIVRNVAAATPSQTAATVLDQLEQDDIDILIADSNCAVATLVMHHRPVPVQAFHENGFAPWAIPELDLVFLGITRPCDRLFADHVTMVRTPRNTASAMQKAPRPPAEIDAMRAYLRTASGVAQPSVVYAFYGRMAKVTADYMAQVQTILAHDPKAIFFAGGTGVCTVVEEAKRSSRVGDRIVLINGFVDGHVVSECIDVFLDTFPFPGGLSCVEAEARGVPVVWMDTDDLPAIIAEYRDPLLRATNARQFVDLAIALADPSARAAARPTALEIAERAGDMSDEAKQVDGHLATVWQRARAKSATAPESRPA
ncbi:hypothetical protein JW805_15345 [Roseomonas aeriglobus]|nr:hypothetical protein [Roseomonas aeriglobus]